MIQKQLHNGNLLNGWSFDNGVGRGIIIGAREIGHFSTESVVMLLSDESGSVHLIINRDKLEAIGGRLHIKDSETPFDPCGIVGA